MDRKWVTYLAGAIEADEEGGTRWRDKVKPELQKLGISVLDPCELEWKKVGMDGVTLHGKLVGYKKSGKWDLFMEAMDAIWLGTPSTPGDFECVRRSDFIVVYVSSKVPTVGTYFEVWEALGNKIPILLVYFGNKSEISSSLLWAVLKSKGEVCSNFNQLLQVVKERIGKK